MADQEAQKALLDIIDEMFDRWEYLDKGQALSRFRPKIRKVLASPGSVSDQGWRATTALELLDHVQRRHHVVRQGQDMECSCGEVFRCPNP